MIDLETEFGRRVVDRLQKDSIIWLTTVRADLTPQPTPVWFLWDGEAFLIFSRRGRQKLRNIARNRMVALTFDSNGQGGDIVIFWGGGQRRSGRSYPSRKSRLPAKVPGGDQESSDG